MRSTNRLTFLLALLFLVTGAYAQDIHYDYDRGANFGSYGPTSGSMPIPVSEKWGPQMGF